MPSITANCPDSWHIQTKRVGEEGLPLLLIDNAVREPDVLALTARQLAFKPIAPSYPGIRAVVPNAYLHEVMPGLLGLLRDVFGYRHGAALQECFFSLVTTRPEALTPMQRLPHFDGVGDEKVAVLHYLCGPEMGGTHFFRHRSTGYESVTSKRFATYKTTVEAEVDRDGLPPQRYPTASGTLFECIASIPAVYNRIVAYRGIALHSIGIPDDFSFAPTPESGRLTVNTFLRPAPPA